MKDTTTITLTFVRETPLARLYEKAAKTGTSKCRQWVPRSVCPRVIQFGDAHEVMIESWWLKANPFETKDGKQAELL